MSNTLPASKNANWIGYLENVGLFINGRDKFYSDNNLNIGFGFNVTAHHSSNDRSLLASVGFNVTDSQWAKIQIASIDPTKETTKALNDALGIQITKQQALQLTDSFLVNVAAQLRTKIPNFDSLPQGAQIALEDVAYNHFTLLGPKTYAAAKAGNLVAVAEELAFNAENKLALGLREANSGLEQRFFADALECLGIVPTFKAGYNIIKSVDISAASPAHILSFLSDVLIAQNLSQGMPTQAALSYIKSWGSSTTQDFTNAVCLVDKAFAQTGTFVCASDKTLFSNIDTAKLNVTGDVFTLLGAQNFAGTIAGFGAGHSLDLADLSIKNDAKIGPDNVLHLHSASGSAIDLKLVADANGYGGSVVTVKPDGHGGSLISIAPTKFQGIQNGDFELGETGTGHYTVPVGWSSVNSFEGVAPYADHYINQIRYSGDYFYDMNTLGLEDAVIYQTVNTLPGQQYALKFGLSFENVDDYYKEITENKNFNARAVLTVNAGDQHSAYAFSKPTGAPFGLPFEEKAIYFTATSDHTLISFVEAANSSYSNDPLIDNVRLEKITSESHTTIADTQLYKAADSSSPNIDAYNNLDNISDVLPFKSIMLTPVDYGGLMM